LFLNQYYFAPGFRADVNFKEAQLDKGEYKIAIIRQQGEQTGILFKNDKLTVTETYKNETKVNW
jgi:hypothetical protein